MSDIRITTFKQEMATEASHMMARYCKVLAQTGKAGYLETDRSENVKFYHRFGFKVMDELQILGVTNCFMWRNAGQ